MKKILVTFFLLTSFKFIAFSQAPNAAMHWSDSVFNSLNDDQRIAQLIILRESSYNQDGPVYYDSLITGAIKKYNIGGIVLFQGHPISRLILLIIFKALPKHH